MRCINCNSTEECKFFYESIDCSSCECVNVIEYNFCSICKLAWKANNNVPIMDTLMHGDIMNTFIDSFVESIKNTDLDDYNHICLECGGSHSSNINGRLFCLTCGNCTEEKV